MSLLVESNFWIFLVLTVVLGGGAAFMAGRALARGWRPVWKVVMFMIPLGAALRFLHYALFQEQLTSLHYFITDTLILLAAALLGYRMTQTAKMVQQYPWLYEKTGPLSWRSKS